MHRAGIVLTGGQSTRMGADKATLVVAGRPMAVWVADALWEAGCHPVVCQGGDVAALVDLGLDARPDTSPGGGPVAAIRDALLAVGTDAVVAACDLPDLDADTVRSLMSAARDDPDRDVVVAAADGRRHLLACWRARAVPAIERCLAEGVTSYLSLLDRLGAADVEVPPAVVRNVNRPDDLE